MAELDYAFLADYASVQAGKLTTVGGSFTFVNVERLPTMMRLYVAGRVRASAETEDIPISVRVVAPTPGLDVQFDGSLASGPDQRPYNGKVGVLFSIEMPLPLQSPGLYEIFVGVEGVERRLAFEVEVQSPA